MGWDKIIRGLRERGSTQEEGARENARALCLSVSLSSSLSAPFKLIHKIKFTQKKTQARAEEHFGARVRLAEPLPRHAGMRAELVEDVGDDVLPEARDAVGHAQGVLEPPHHLEI